MVCNLTIVTTEQIVNCLKENLQYESIVQSQLHQVVIQQVAEERGIMLTEEEVRRAADQQRIQLRLERATDTLAWLADQQVTPQEWEAGIRTRLLREKLAVHLFAQEAEKRFWEHRIDYDRAVLYQITVAQPELAQELFYRIGAGETSFFEAAYQFDIDESRRWRCGFEGIIQRWQIQPKISTLVFNAKPGELTGTVQTDLGYHILWVREFLPAELTENLRQELVQALFQEWLQAELTYRLYHQVESEAMAEADGLPTSEGMAGARIG